MITVWFKKYLEDEDLCLVDYIRFKSNAEIEPPQISFCFTQPFIDQNLEKLGVNSIEYLRHLEGVTFVENLTNIDFTNVTLNLEHNYISTDVLYVNGSRRSSIDADIHSTFNGFWYTLFMKCFSVDTHKFNVADAKFVTHRFKLEFYHQLKDTLVFFHGRNRLLITDSGKFIPSDENSTTGISKIIFIEKVEILQRRNKRSSPCLTNWKNWDGLVLLKFINEIGCLAPYHGFYQNFPTCSTAKELIKWREMVPTVKSEENDLPCQVMPRITHDVAKGRNPMNKEFWLNIQYPRRAKIVTQSPAVDANALIGNIGGYIGLFLGMFASFN